MKTFKKTCRRRLLRRGFLAALALSMLPSAAPRAQQDRLSSSQEIRGQVTVREFTTLANEISAKIDRITVREGDRFKKDAALIFLDCAIHEAEFERAKAVHAATRKVLEVNQRLQKLNSIGELELHLSEVEVAKAEADMKIGQVTLDKCVIKAPFPGRVVKLEAREKQFLDLGQPILKIHNDADLEISFIMPSLWTGRVTTGTKLKIHIEETGRDYPVRVSRFGAQVDPVSRTIEVRGDIVGKHPGLLPGMSGVILGIPEHE